MANHYENLPTPTFTNKQMKEENMEVRVLTQGYMSTLDISTVDVPNTEYTILNRMEEQGWEKFVTTKFPVCEKMVIWFYRHVIFPSVESEEIVWRVSVNNDGNAETLEYGDKQMLADHGIPTSGERNIFALPLAEDARMIMRDWKSDFEYNRYTLTKWRLMRIVQTIILPSTSQHELGLQIRVAELLKQGTKMNLTKMINFLMFNASLAPDIKLLPYGGLITHIVRKWGTVHPGPFLSRSILYNNQYFTNQIHLALTIRNSEYTATNDDTTTEFTEAEFRVRALVTTMKDNLRTLIWEILEAEKRLKKGNKRKKQLIKGIKTFTDGIIEDKGSQARNV